MRGGYSMWGGMDVYYMALCMEHWLGCISWRVTSATALKAETTK